MENFNEILNKLSTIVANVAECKLGEVQDLQAESNLHRASYFVHS